MLGDGSRGAIIEMTLAKVLYISSKCDCYFTLIIFIFIHTHHIHGEGRCFENVWETDFLLYRVNSDHWNECYSGQCPRYTEVSEGRELH